MATTYLYSVSPKKPIRFLCGAAVVPPIRTPRSIQMTLEQVRDCIKYGSVYRRFNEEGRNERVTTANVERLHNAHYMTEEEFNSLVSNVTKTEEVKEVVAPKAEENRRGQVEIIEQVEPTIMVSVTNTQENSMVDQTDVIVEESIEDVEDVDNSSDEIVESTEEVENESTDEEVEEDTDNDEVELSERTESYTNKNSYNHNNKNRNKKNRH